MLYWLIASPALLGLAFFVPFLIWVGASLVGFLAPELFSLIKKDDSYPPLTHTIRHFLPNWVAFPIIYGALGSVGAHWLVPVYQLAVGLLMALLGWLTDHFAVTYQRKDPYPFSGKVKIEEPPAPA